MQALRTETAWSLRARESQEERSERVAGSGGAVMSDGIPVRPGSSGGRDEPEWQRMRCLSGTACLPVFRSVTGEAEGWTGGPRETGGRRPVAVVT